MCDVIAFECRCGDPDCIREVKLHPNNLLQVWDGMELLSAVVPDEIADAIREAFEKLKEKED